MRPLRRILSLNSPSHPRLLTWPSKLEPPARHPNNSETRHRKPITGPATLSLSGHRAAAQRNPSLPLTLYKSAPFALKKSTTSNPHPRLVWTPPTLVIRTTLPSLLLHPRKQKQA